MFFEHLECFGAQFILRDVWCQSRQFFMLLSHYSAHFARLFSPHFGKNSRGTFQLPNYQVKRVSDLFRCLPKVFKTSACVQKLKSVRRQTAFTKISDTTLHQTPNKCSHHKSRFWRRIGQTMESEHESGCSAFTLTEEGMERMGMAALSRSDLIVLTASSTSSPSVRIPSRMVSRVMPFSGIMVGSGERPVCDWHWGRQLVKQLVSLGGIRSLQQTSHVMEGGRRKKGPNMKASDKWI